MRSQKRHNVLSRRIKRVSSLLKAQGLEAAMLLSSAAYATRSHDTSYPYRQDSGLFYLTHTLRDDLLLLISTRHAKPILFAPKPNPTRLLWEGEQESPRSIAERIDAELLVVDDPAVQALGALKDTTVLYFQNAPRCASWQIAERLITTPSHRRATFPSHFAHADVILDEMRLYKDAHEIEAIVNAAQITSEALKAAFALALPGRMEVEVAAAFEFGVRAAGAGLAFNTIVASGPNAAVLHYEKCNRQLRRGEMLLIDCGAEYELYAADITRVVPVGGDFTPVQRDIYNIVMSAQSAAIAKIRPGVRYEAVQAAAVRELVIGLVELKVLRGKTSALIEKKAYKPYFPHGIGHALGLDVHDGTRIRLTDGVLQSGMVLTIEPGLYFKDKLKNILPCGVRIEDDVAVTDKGSYVLTSAVPKQIPQVRSLLNGVHAAA